MAHTIHDKVLSKSDKERLRKRAYRLTLSQEKRKAILEKDRERAKRRRDDIMLQQSLTRKKNRQRKRLSRMKQNACKEVPVTPNSFGVLLKKIISVSKNFPQEKFST